MAAGALQKATEVGLHVPGKLKVVGYDNNPMAAIWPIPISSFDAGMDKIGRAGARILLSMMRGKLPRRMEVLMPTKFMPRRSSQVDHPDADSNARSGSGGSPAIP